MGCTEGRSPFAGSLRVSLSYKFFPLPGEEGGQGGWSKGFFNILLGQVVTHGVHRALTAVLGNILAGGGGRQRSLGGGGYRLLKFA